LEKKSLSEQACKTCCCLFLLLLLGDLGFLLLFLALGRSGCGCCGESGLLDSLFDVDAFKRCDQGLYLGLVLGQRP
jgi:hypothetical protein